MAENMLMTSAGRGADIEDRVQVIPRLCCAYIFVTQESSLPSIREVCSPHDTEVLQHTADANLGNYFRLEV